MRIIAWVNGNSGPSYHRIIMPLMLMKDVDVYITNDLHEKDFEKGCDIFMYNRVLPEHSLEKIAELKKKYGFKICLDIDDHWELDPHHILYQHYIDIKFAENQISQLKAADIITTTHERLRSEILELFMDSSYVVNHVYILPNAIPKAGQFDIEREPYYLTRLFWQGSITHREDIALLETPVKGLQNIAGKIKMIMAGYMENEPEWDVMARMYTANLKHQYKIIPGLHITEYYSAYKNADICLVPLVNSKFNRMKSNLKVLEAANLGLPVIASQVHPYMDMPLLYCRNSSDWIKHIRRLVESKKRRKEAGQELQEFCNQHFNFNKINKERKQIFEYESSRQTIFK